MAARSAGFFLPNEKALRSFLPNESFSGVTTCGEAGGFEACCLRGVLTDCVELLTEGGVVLIFTGPDTVEFIGVWKARVGVCVTTLLVGGI